MLKIKKVSILALLGFSTFLCKPSSSSSSDPLVPLALLGSMSTFVEEVPYSTCENSPEFTVDTPVGDDISDYTIKFYKYTAGEDENTSLSVQGTGRSSAYVCVLAFKENMIVDTNSSLDTLESNQSMDYCQSSTMVQSKSGATRCVAVLGVSKGSFSLTASSSVPYGVTTNKIFVTGSTMNGNLGGLSGADGKCNNDINKPYSNSSTTAMPYYKAILYGNNALAPNTTYYTPEQTRLWKTDSSGNLPSNLLHAPYITAFTTWTGDATNNCNSWMSTTGYSGVSGLANTTDSSIFLSNSIVPCDNTENRLYCAQQVATGEGATITSFSPTSGAIGSTITINGTGFSATATNNSVFFNGVLGTVTASTSTQLTVTVPSNIPKTSYYTYDAKLYVVVNNLVSYPTSYPNMFIVITPFISSLSSSGGFVGNYVTIFGNNFSSVNSENIVKFNGVTGTVTSSSPSMLYVRIPVGATVGNVTVTTSAGTAISPSMFTPIPTSYTPTYDFTNGLPSEWTGTNAWTINTTACPTSGNGNCLRSTSIGDSASSVIQFTASVNTGIIVFRRKVSSEWGSDYCVFKIDGSTAEGTGVYGEQDSIYAFPVSTGTHTFSWTYTKDFSTVRGTDSCSIDDVLLP